MVSVTARSPLAMSISVHVGLLSGKTATVTARFHENVETLMCRSQTALGVGRGRLLDSLGSVLDAHESIKDSGLQSGDSLILQICPVQACRAASAFATILSDGSVATWGKALLGGDCSAAQDKLANVRQIQATLNAFAAILADGSVVTWGGPRYGGDSSGVQDKLKDVQQIQASSRAFAAIPGDGSVVTWGDACRGGDTSGVRDRLANVQHIQANPNAFAAILGDGSELGRRYFRW